MIRLIYVCINSCVSLSKASGSHFISNSTTGYSTAFHHHVMKLGDICQFILSKEGRKQVRKWATQSFADCHDTTMHKASGSRSLEEATTKQTAWKQPTHNRTLHRAIVLAFESAGFIRAEYWCGQGHSCSPPKIRHPMPRQPSHTSMPVEWNPCKSTSSTGSQF